MKDIITNLFLIFFFSFVNIYAKNCYVDKEAAGNRNGTSWINAWQRFADISGLSSGDIVYISGGSTSKTYNEPLICVTGVTYQTGQDNGHNGTVIIDCMDSRDHCIQLANNVTISGQVGIERRMLIKNSFDTGIKSNSASGITITYVEVTDCGSRNGTFPHGIHLRGADNCEVSYCYIHHNYQDGYNAGGSSEAGWGRNKVHHNIIEHNSDDGVACRGGHDIFNNVIANNYYHPGQGSGHPDGIQAQGRYSRIYNNEIYNNHTFQIFVDQINIAAPNKGGYAYVYNNVCYITDKNNIPNGIGIVYKAESSVSGGVTDVFIFNNTVVDMGYSGIHIHNIYGSITNSFIKNNIIMNCRTSGRSGYVCGTSEISGVEIDYNLINPGISGGNRIEWGGTTYNYSDFVNRGYGQQHGQTGMPSFVEYSQWNTEDLHLAYSDKVLVKDKGIDMSSFSSEDKDGNPRPKGAAWDIGAYEAPSPPSALRFIR